MWPGNPKEPQPVTILGRTTQKCHQDGLTWCHLHRNSSLASCLSEDRVSVHLPLGKASSQRDCETGIEPLLLDLRHRLPREHDSV